MPAIRTLAIFCGSNVGRGNVYTDAARRLGEAIAAQGLGIVYGGTHKGLMGILADSVLAGGGEAHGVITRRLHDKGHAHTGLTRSEIVATMRERKARMAECADAFIALPGGIGTLEEFMEAWTLNQLGEIDKPAGLYNVAGFYDPLMALVDHMIDESFLPAAHRDSIVVDADPDTLITGLREFEKVTVPKWL